MIFDEDKHGKSLDVEIKHGVFGRNWFIAALSIVSTKLTYL